MGAIHDNARRNPAWQALVLGLFYLACFLAAGLGSLFTMVSLGSWYTGLAKPAWNPPSWVFGPVWTLLYVLIGVSAWRVWRVGGFRRDPVALALFAAQWTLNFAWTGIFFGLRRPGLALAEIVALLVLIAATALRFRRHDRAAAWLLAPYLAWVAFATALNAAFWWLNRG